MARSILLPLIAALAIGVPAAATAADTSPPKTKITGGPRGATADATPGFSFKSSEKGSKSSAASTEATSALARLPGR